MNPNLTREQFERLLQAYTDAYGLAIHAEMGTSKDYYGLLVEKAIVAKQAHLKRRCLDESESRSGAPKRYASSRYR